MIHELKTWPSFWEAVYNGTKTFEVRKNDRDFKKGDTLILQEWDTENMDYTSRWLSCKVIYVLHGGNFGIEEGYVVMSIKK
jgi:ASC-1-like (ASCH) protein